jgi:hypothetical protein
VVRRSRRAETDILRTSEAMRCFLPRAEAPVEEVEEATLLALTQARVVTPTGSRTTSCLEPQHASGRRQVTTPEG